MTNSEMDVRGYEPADGTYYEYKDEEETPRGVHYKKTQDEDINASTIGRYAETKDFKHWPCDHHSLPKCSCAQPLEQRVSNHLDELPKERRGRGMLPT